MKVRFSALTTAELDDATKYYDAQFAGLGKRFRMEVRNAAVRISQYPKAWSIERGEVRKCLLHRFPYKLLYSIEKDHVLIIAVAHQHGKPDYWIDRHET